MIQNGRTALIVAVKNGHLEVVKLLVNSGASVNAVIEVSVRVSNKQPHARP